MGPAPRGATPKSGCASATAASHPLVVTTSLLTGAGLPSFELERTESKSPTNPLGVKGVGETGTIAAAPAVIGAVIDALAHLGVKDIQMPATPERVWRAIQEAKT